VDTKDGVSITENTDLDGFTSTIDTCDGQTVAGPGCASEAYDSTGLTDDEVQYVSRYAAREYVGTKMATAAEICICEIEYQTGSLSGFVGGGDNDCTLPDCPDYYAMLFTVDGNDDLSVKLGTSNGIDGDDIADVGSVTTWTFDPCVTVVAGNYAIVIIGDTDGDTTDDPEVAADRGDDDYFAIDADNNNNGDAIQLGRFDWSHDGSIPYADQSSEVNDDQLMTYSTQ
jgi:hypothetical protein